MSIDYDGPINVNRLYDEYNGLIFQRFAFPRVNPDHYDMEMSPTVACAPADIFIYIPNCLIAIYAISPVLISNAPSSISNRGLCSGATIPFPTLPVPRK